MATPADARRSAGHGRTVVSDQSRTPLTSRPEAKAQRIPPGEVRSGAILPGHTALFYIDIPSACQQLVVHLHKGSGDPLLMLRSASPPRVPRRSRIIADFWDQEAFNANASDHHVAVDSLSGLLTPGIWYIGVMNYNFHVRETCRYALTVSVSGGEATGEDVDSLADPYETPAPAVVSSNGRPTSATGPPPRPSNTFRQAASRQRPPLSSNGVRRAQPVDEFAATAPVGTTPGPAEAATLSKTINVLSDEVQHARRALEEGRRAERARRLVDLWMVGLRLHLAGSLSTWRAFTGRGHAARKERVQAIVHGKDRPRDRALEGEVRRLEAALAEAFEQATFARDHAGDLSAKLEQASEQAVDHGTVEVEHLLALLRARGDTAALVSASQRDADPGSPLVRLHASLGGPLQQLVQHKIDAWRGAQDTRLVQLAHRLGQELVRKPRGRTATRLRDDADDR